MWWNPNVVRNNEIFTHLFKLLESISGFSTSQCEFFSRPDVQNTAVRLKLSQESLISNETAQSTTKIESYYSALNWRLCCHSSQWKLPCVVGDTYKLKRDCTSSNCAMLFKSCVSRLFRLTCFSCISHVLVRFPDCQKKVNVVESTDL